MPSPDTRMDHEQQIRAALAWVTRQATSQKETFTWLWEAIQGDFNDERSAGQIAFDTGISMIPFVDQICDLRDLIANCKSIAQSKSEDDNSWKWVTLALTLIGLFPSLGSLLKGVLKIFFVFIRRYGFNHVAHAVDEGLAWVITYLRKREVARYWQTWRVDNILNTLAQNIRQLKAKVTGSTLLSAFDDSIAALKSLEAKVRWLPNIGEQVRKTLALVEDIRRKADAPLGKALTPVQKILDTIVLRLEKEILNSHRAVINVRNVHFRGSLPEELSVSLMREHKPKWMTQGRELRYSQLKPKNAKLRDEINEKKLKGWPSLDENNIRSFHKLEAAEIKGPAKIFRIVSPSNQAMGDCWVSEEVFKKIIESPDPKAAWRKYLGVWPDWNANGQFVVLEISAGESLKVWRGPTASQVKKPQFGLDGQLEGGWEQLIVKPTAYNKLAPDTYLFYSKNPKTGKLGLPTLSDAEYKALPKEAQANFVGLRQELNDPHLKGPFDTNWGATDFEVQFLNTRLGLPAAPGQLSNSAYTGDI